MNKKMMIRMAAALFVASALMTGCQKTETTADSADTGATQSTKADVKTQTFTNAPDGLTGELKRNYVDFAFTYPESWVIDPSSSQDGSSNFVRLERRLTDKGGKFTQENFAVGYFVGTGTAHGDKELMPKVAKQLENKFAEGFDGYKLISQGPMKIGGYQGYGFRFESLVKNTPHGPITVWGRAVLLPNPEKGNKHGATVLMMASSLVPEIKSASDVGVKGQLPIILKSFTLGKQNQDSKS